MEKDISIQLVVNYHHLNTTLKFSPISHTLSHEAIFRTFVAELSSAIRVIKELRDLSKQAAFPDEKQQADELLDKVVQSTAAYYALIRAYADEGRHIRHEMSEQPKMISEEVRTKVSFVEQWGRFIYELGAPTAALKGYLELVRTYSPQLAEIKRQEVFTIFDIIIERVLDLLVPYQKHLDGEINLLDWDWNQRCNFFQSAS